MSESKQSAMPKTRFKTTLFYYPTGVGHIALKQRDLSKLPEIADVYFSWGLQSKHSPADWTDIHTYGSPIVITLPETQVSLAQLKEEFDKSSHFDITALRGDNCASSAKQMLSKLYPSSQLSRWIITPADLAKHLSGRTLQDTRIKLEELLEKYKVKECRCVQMLEKGVQLNINEEHSDKGTIYLYDETEEGLIAYWFENNLLKHHAINQEKQQKIEEMMNKSSVITHAADRNSVDEISSLCGYVSGKHWIRDIVSAMELMKLFGTQEDKKHVAALKLQYPELALQMAINQLERHANFMEMQNWFGKTVQEFSGLVRKIQTSERPEITNEQIENLRSLHLDAYRRSVNTITLALLSTAAATPYILNTAGQDRFLPSLECGKTEDMVAWGALFFVTMAMLLFTACLLRGHMPYVFNMNTSSLGNICDEMSGIQRQMAEDGKNASSIVTR